MLEELLTRSGLFRQNTQISRKMLESLAHGAKVMSGFERGKYGAKIRRKWFPNIRIVPLYSKALDKMIPVSVWSKKLRSIELYYGGLDNYLIKTEDPLPAKYEALKQEILEALRKKK